MQAAVKVWPTITGEISSLVYGHFVEHLGRCIYGGVLDPMCSKVDPHGFRLDVAGAVRNIKCSLLRWPGGNFASAYHWMDGVGPIGERPQHINYIWGGFEPNRFGTDEFLEYCWLVGAAPYITINLGTGTLDEALHWLEYCKLNTITELSRLRKKNKTYTHAWYKGRLRKIGKILQNHSFKMECELAPLSLDTLLGGAYNVIDTGNGIKGGLV